MLQITQAFVLGAGLGTRLRPLTEQLPKPLVPIFQKPLITFALDHLIDAGCQKACVNTHHQPQEFTKHFPENTHRGMPLQFRHEPVLLETAGGIANVADLLGDEPFLVYNADILSDLPLAPLLAEHASAENIVTLALRSGGGPQHIAFDREQRRVTDIHDLLQTGQPQEFVFTGIYAVQPEFMQWIEPGVKRSVISAFLEMIRRGARLGGVIVDEGNWWDVGTRAAYLQLHRDLSKLPFPRYGAPNKSWRDPVHPTATIAAGAELRGYSVAGARVQIGAGAMIEDTILWPGAVVAPGSELRNCIVRAGLQAAGVLRDVDI